MASRSESGAAPATVIEIKRIKRPLRPQTAWEGDPRLQAGVLDACTDGSKARRPASRENWGVAVGDAGCGALR